MDLSNLLHHDPTELNPGAGHLLLAEPLMQDTMFGRSVIMVLERDRNGGHIGLALNKGPVCYLNDLIEDAEPLPHIPIFQGGPVDVGRLFMLHRLGNKFSNAIEIAPGMYIGANEDEVIDYLLTHPERSGEIRFFIGYSGWESGQLTSEIMRSSWALNTHPDTSLLLTGQGDEFWRREVENLGPDYRSWLIVPENPSLN